MLVILINFLKVKIMKTPINIKLATLPPIITFFTSNYLAGDCFPLSIGIFANGKAYAWHISPQVHWKLDHYDSAVYAGTPLSFFYEHGDPSHSIKAIVENLVGFQKVVFCLNFAHDKYSLEQLGCTDLIVKDIEEIDSFDHYGERIDQLVKTMKDSKLNKYSVKDVVTTLAYQTLDNLRYQDLSVMRYALFRYAVDHSK
jgi:hypothetical protein